MLVLNYIIGQWDLEFKINKMKSLNVPFNQIWQKNPLNNSFSLIMIMI